MPCCVRRSFDDGERLAANFLSLAGGLAGDPAARLLYGAGVRSSADLAGPAFAAHRESSLPAHRRGRKPRNGLEGIRPGSALVQRSFHDSALRAGAGAAVGVVAVESAKAAGSASGAGLKHGG